MLVTVRFDSHKAHSFCHDQNSETCTVLPDGSEFLAESVGRKASREAERECAGLGGRPLLEEVDVVEHGVRLLDLLHVDEASHSDPRQEAVFSVVIGHELRRRELCEDDSEHGSLPASRRRQSCSRRVLNAKRAKNDWSGFCENLVVKGPHV